MISVDVIIVGGGPTGSTCAWRLTRAGVDRLALDKETFPRLRLCADWVTLEVVRDVDVDIANYPHRFISFGKLHVHAPYAGFGARFSLPGKLASRALKYLAGLLAARLERYLLAVPATVSA